MYSLKERGSLEAAPASPTSEEESQREASNTYSGLPRLYGEAPSEVDAAIGQQALGDEESQDLMEDPGPLAQGARTTLEGDEGTSNDGVDQASVPRRLRDLAVDLLNTPSELDGRRSRFQRFASGARRLARQGTHTDSEQRGRARALHRLRRVIRREDARAQASADHDRLVEAYGHLSRPGASLNLDASVTLGLDALQTILTAAGFGIPIPSSFLGAVSADLTLGVQGKVVTGDDTRIRPSLTFSLKGRIGAELIALGAVGGEVSGRFKMGGAYEGVDHFVAHYMRSLALFVRRVSASQLRKLHGAEKKASTDEAWIRGQAIDAGLLNACEEEELQTGTAAYAALRALQKRPPVKSTAAGVELAADADAVLGLLKGTALASARVTRFVRRVDRAAFDEANGTKNPHDRATKKLTKLGISSEVEVSDKVGPFDVKLLWELIHNDANPDNDGNYVTFTIHGAVAALVGLLQPPGAIESAAGEPVAAGGAATASESAAPGAQSDVVPAESAQSDVASAAAEGPAVSPEGAPPPEAQLTGAQAFVESISKALAAQSFSLASLTSLKLSDLLGGLLDIAVPSQLPFGVNLGFGAGYSLSCVVGNGKNPFNTRWRPLYARLQHDRGLTAGVSHIPVYGGATVGMKAGGSKTVVQGEWMGTNTLDYLKIVYLGMKKHPRFQEEWNAWVGSNRSTLRKLFSNVCKDDTQARDEAEELGVEIPVGGDFDQVRRAIERALDRIHARRSSLAVDDLRDTGWDPVAVSRWRGLS